MTRFVRHRIVLAMGVLLLLCGVAPASVCAQDETYKFDFGANVGMSGYIGDATGGNMFAHPGVAAGLAFNYRPDSRWAVGGMLSTASLKGDTADSDNYLPDGARYTFTSQVFDLSGRVEFNFFSFGMGETYKRLRRWTPYMAVGVGMSLASVKNDKAYVGLSIPMAVGVKFMVKPRLALRAEMRMTKVLTDNLDGIDDPLRIESNFLKNNDWHSAITVGFSYEFGKRCQACHYVD